VSVGRAGRVMLEWIALLTAVLFTLLLSHSSDHNLAQAVGECAFLAALYLCSSAVLVDAGATLLQSPLGVFGFLSPEYFA